MNPRDKVFKIPGSQIRRLIPNMGACIASDRITVNGVPVGYMYREHPHEQTDSGWRFFAGDESQEYSDTPDHFANALQRTAAGHRGCHRRAPWQPSLNFIRYVESEYVTLK